jgi:hypothetical protein
MTDGVDGVRFEVSGFWLPDEVAELAGIEGLECSTGDGYVIVHPRPRELTDDEVPALRKAFETTEKPDSAARWAEMAAEASAKASDSAAKVQAFRDKVSAGSVNVDDLCQVVMALTE